MFLFVSTNFLARLPISFKFVKSFLKHKCIAGYPTPLNPLDKTPRDKIEKNASPFPC